MLLLHKKSFFQINKIFTLIFYHNSPFYYKICYNHCNLKGVFMPNYVKNIVKAPIHVIESMRDEKNNTIDFNLICKWDGYFPFNGVIISAEDLAKKIIKKSIGLNLENYLEIVDFNLEKERKSKPSQFEDDEIQVKLMVKNYLETGYLHDMDFNRNVWGTKWNACEGFINDKKEAKFETAWSTPLPLMIKLSEKFPESKIEVHYADEDMGYNCGYYVLQNGQVIEDVDRDKLNENDENGSLKFALNIHGISYDDFMKEME